MRDDLPVSNCEQCGRPILDRGWTHRVVHATYVEDPAESTGSPIAFPSSTSRSSRIGFGSESWTSLPRPEILRAR